MTSLRTAACATLAASALALLTTTAPLAAREAGAATRQTVRRGSGEARYATGTIILKLHPAVANRRGSVAFGVPSIDAVMQQIGARARMPLFPLAPWSELVPSGVGGTEPDAGFDRVYVVGYDGPFDAKWVAERLVATQAAEYAEPYYFFATDAMPVNDPQAVQQYWLEIIKAQDAWDISQGSRDVVIAIVDSGVDWTHEDLADNIWQNPGESGTDGSGKDRRSNGVDDDENGVVDDWHGWDLVGDIDYAAQLGRRFVPDNDPSPTAMNSPGYAGYHGTTVAGCAAARTNNGKGIAAPGYNARILPVKAAADASTGSINAGYEGIVYAADLQATIINCSFGGEVTGGSQALQQVVDYARAQGSLVIAASGNAAQNIEAVPHVPAALRGVLSVGGTSSSDYADTTYTNSGLGVHVYAPGTNVLTTYPGNQYVANGVTGTSFSSPIVAGVAALVLSAHPEWSADQVAMQLRVTGDRVRFTSATRFAPHFYRRVNALRALAINRSLSGGERFPGIRVTSLTINGKTRDSVRSATEKVTVQLKLENLLAPTVALAIDTWPGQMLRTTRPTSVPVIATGGTATAEIELEVDPQTAERYSEGMFDLVLRFTDGEFEDVVPIRVPVKIPGWRQQSKFGSNSTKYLTQAIDATSPTNAWAIANVNEERPTFARTLDGRTWQTFRTIVSAAEQAYCLDALDAQTAWVGSSPASGAASIFRTADGGTTWTKTSVASITRFVNAVHFFDATNGIMLGDPINGRWGIGITGDGGATWSPIAQAVEAGSGEAGWNNAFAAFGDNLWFGTNNNRVFRSTDRGRTWTSSQTPAVSSFSFAFTSPSNGIAVFKRTVVNNAWYGQNMVATTRDGGASWQPLALPFGMTGDVVSAVPGSERIVLSSESGIVETRDLGATWTVVSAPPAIYNWKVSEFGARIAKGVQLSMVADGDVVAGFAVDGDARFIGYSEAPPVQTSVPADDRATTSISAYPNPSTGATTVAFELTAAGDVALELFDTHGARVRSIARGRFASGRHAVVVDASSLPAGTYRAVLDVDARRSSAPIVVVR